MISVAYSYRKSDRKSATGGSPPHPPSGRRNLLPLGRGRFLSRKAIDFRGDLRVATLATLLLAAPIAHARPPAGTHNDPATSAWFRGLRNPATGIGCCSDADCRRVETRTEGGRWQFWLKRGEGEGEFPEAPEQARWEDVPDAAIMPHEENPTGSAVACWGPSYTGWTAPGSGVLCFVLPTMS